jgi:hypothetical protein
MATDRYILDEHDNPQPCEDLTEWARFYESDRRRVAQDLDEGNDADGTRVRVSTVFLGLDHNYFGKGPPILWETLVFGGVLDGEMDRYTSREAALRGHQAMCQRVNDTIQTMTPLEVELLIALKQVFERMQGYQLTVDREFRNSTDPADVEAQEFEAYITALIAKADSRHDPPMTADSQSSDVTTRFVSARTRADGHDVAQSVRDAARSN